MQLKDMSIFSTQAYVLIWHRITVTLLEHKTKWLWMPRSNEIVVWNNERQNKKNAKSWQKLIG